MDPVLAFRESCLTPEDAAAFANALQACIQSLGWEQCWDLSQSALSHAIFNGFSTSHSTRLTYKGQDARPLLLALADQHYRDEAPVIVRRACCSSRYCLNPSHVYYGAKGDVSFENARRTKSPGAKSTSVTKQLIVAMQAERTSGGSVATIARKYKLPYHTARRICNGETYADASSVVDEAYLNNVRNRTIENCLKICENYPEADRVVRLTYYVMEKTECPWHHPKSDKHKGNFGLMGECLDCMEEIRAGRCTVDVTEFSMEWYWTVKRFWEQVDICSEEECWPWKGATRRDNKESIAYLPSPFHSSKVQSAPRVAYWLSRGYTGKYKVSSQPGCKAFCCNPKHLQIREFKDLLPPAKITEIRLSHGNIFQHYRENLAQKKPAAAD